MTLRAVALRLEGVAQSWGGPYAGDIRPTEAFPTRSGVLGLLGAALGIERRHVSQLVELDRGIELAVRVDRAGSLGIDYHTAQGVPDLVTPAPDWDEPELEEQDTVQTWRHYLYDASFAVAVVWTQRAPVTLDAMVWALRHPRFALYLGRKACVASVPVVARSQPTVEGNTWRELLAAIPTAPGTPGETRQAFVDEALLGPDDQPEQRLRVRDVIIGPLRRRFYERTVARIPWSAPRPGGAGGDLDRAARNREAPPPDFNDGDTTEGWL